MNTTKLFLLSENSVFQRDNLFYVECFYRNQQIFFFETRRSYAVKVILKLTIKFTVVCVVNTIRTKTSKCFCSCTTIIVALRIIKIVFAGCVCLMTTFARRHPLCFACFVQAQKGEDADKFN